MTGPGHPGPHPAPSPTGPIRVRDLIHAARAAGAHHTAYGWLGSTEHVWRTADMQVSWEPRDGYGLLEIPVRLRPGDRLRHSRIVVTSPGQAWAVLAALGVLPAAGQPDPCPFCARWRQLQDTIAADARDLAGAA